MIVSYEGTFLEECGFMSLVWLFGVGCAAGVGAVGYLFFALQKVKYELSSAEKENSSLCQRLNDLQQEYDLEHNEKTILHEKSAQQLAERTEAVTRLSELEKRLDDAIEKQMAAEAHTVEALEEKFHYEKQAELAYQKLQELEYRMEDWERTKQESLKAAKEAMFETGSEVFRKEAELVHEKTQEGFQSLLKNVSSLHDRLITQEDVVGTVWKALSTPAGAGRISEIGLENCLSAYGLQQGRDFIMQYTVSGEEFGRQLRPDAVVFLPAGTVLVIDSKASKFFLELAEVEGTEYEEEVLAGLTRTMVEHLKTLASKGYKDAVQAYMKAAGKDEKIRQVLTVMYLHTESAVEKLCAADTGFRTRAQEMGIILTGPTGLAGLLSLAQVEIKREKQEQNQQHIIDELSGLLGYLETALNYAASVGKSIRSAAEHYHRFTKSVNSRLLPKGKKLYDLGVELPKNKQLPSQMTEYHVLADEAPVIEGDSADSAKTLEREHNNEGVAADIPDKVLEEA